MEFLEHLQKFGELLIQFSLFQVLRIQNWDNGFNLVWSTLILCFFFTQLFLMGLFPYYFVSLARLDYFFCSTFPITGGCPGAASSLPILNVKAFTFSLPSCLGFTSELLGSALRCLPVNRLAIWPIFTSKFLSCAA